MSPGTGDSSTGDVTQWQDALVRVIKRYQVPRSPDLEARGREDRDEAASGYSLVNRTCGDRVTVYGEPPDCRIDARGCAICRAASEIAGALLQGLSGPEALRFSERIIACLRGELSTDSLDLPAGVKPELQEDLRALLHVREYPGRLRCATLSWEAVRDVLLRSR